MMQPMINKWRASGPYMIQLCVFFCWRFTNKWGAKVFVMLTAANASSMTKGVGLPSVTCGLCQSHTFDVAGCANHNDHEVAVTWYSCAYFSADTSHTHEVQRFLPCSGSLWYLSFAIFRKGEGRTDQCYRDCPRWLRFMARAVAVRVIPVFSHQSANRC